MSLFALDRSFSFLHPSILFPVAHKRHPFGSLIIIELARDQLFGETNAAIVGGDRFFPGNWRDWETYALCRKIAAAKRFDSFFFFFNDCRVLFGITFKDKWPTDTMSGESRTFSIVTLSKPLIRLDFVEELRSFSCVSASRHTYITRKIMITTMIASDDKLD